MYLQNAAADVEKMILGNKCDLSESRVVSKERGQLLADEHSIKFMETSAKASINVEEVCICLFCAVCVCVCACCLCCYLF